MRSDTTAPPAPGAARGAVAILANRRGELLLHLRDDLDEGVELRFFAPEHLDILTIPPFIRGGIHRHLAARPC
ncbi:hypothetical protein [Streptomyces sp. LaBMicrA B280]|uniref:hypothetical protein n=1 Tax=Streptomyces sp. LaBMicrA B280 TaxID=3391001 RepID=UPI003BA60E3F